MKAIERDFGSVDKMKEKLSASTVAVQGSGWGWLGYNKATGKLQIATCANQVSRGGCSPLICSSDVECCWHWSTDLFSDYAARLKIVTKLAFSSFLHILFTSPLNQ